MSKDRKEFAVMVAEMMKAQRDYKKYKKSVCCLTDGGKLEKLKRRKKEKEAAVIDEIYEQLYPLSTFEK